MLKKFGTSIKKYANRTCDRITGPLLPPGQTRAAGRHKCLDSDGLACVGERLQPNDIYINKYMPINTRDPFANPGELPESHYRPVPMSWKVRSFRPRRWEAESGK